MRANGRIAACLLDFCASLPINGAHDGFPGYEIFIVRPETGNSEAKLIYGHDPREKSQTPLSLFPPMEFKVSKSVTCDSKRKCKED